MARWTVLDVVNACLGSMGEAPQSALISENPYAVAAKKLLERMNTDKQAPGFWFNREILRIDADPETGELRLPTDTLDVRVSDPHGYLVKRGQRLYNPLEGTYDVGATVTVQLIREIPFADLDPIPQEYIAYHVVSKFQKDYDADQAKVKQTDNDLEQARRTLNATETRNANVNMLTTVASAAQRVKVFGGRVRSSRR